MYALYVYMYMAQTGSMCWNPLSLFQHIHLVGATPPWSLHLRISIPLDKNGKKLRSGWFQHIGL